MIQRVDGASTRIGRNPDTCKRGAALIKLMGYECREDAEGVGEQAMSNIPTPTQCPLVIHGMDGASGRIGRNLDT